MKRPSGFGVTSEQLLLHDGLAPITSSVGFLKAPLDAVSSAFVKWNQVTLRDVMRDPRGTVTTKSLDGDLEPNLRRLAPLRTVKPNRFLFVTTHGDWLAYFDNFSQGTDAFGPISFLAETLGVEGARVVAIPNTIDGQNDRGAGRYGALMLEIYGPTAPADGLNIRRHISLMNDGGQWTFDETGTLLSFEQEEAYARRSVMNRFTFEMLKAYCAELGLEPFTVSFYRRQAILVEIDSKIPKNARDVRLEDVRKYFGLV